MEYCIAGNFCRIKFLPIRSKSCVSVFFAASFLQVSCYKPHDYKYTVQNVDGGIFAGYYCTCKIESFFHTKVPAIRYICTCVCREVDNQGSAHSGRRWLAMTTTQSPPTITAPAATN